MAYPNVTGVGVGLRVVGGERRDEVCLRVYVRRKVPEEELRPADVLPRTVEGVPVDVVAGEFRLMQHGEPALPLAERTARHAPFLLPGISVAGLRVTAGTLGAAVYDVGQGGRQLLLSNWHVLCGAADCAPGEAIVQPGPFDGGEAPRDTVATLVRFADTDRVDAAVAEVRPHRFLLEAAPGLGLVRGTGGVALGARVRKCGRTTGITTGVVDDVSADVLVGPRLFRGQISVAADGAGVIVAGGDSGSLTVDERDLAVGLLFAGRVDGSLWLANPIAEVVAALGIRFPPALAPLHVTAVLAS